MSKEISVLKLTNGDEIVAYTTEQLDGSVVCSKIRSMQVVPTKSGPQAALVPWMVATPDVDVTFRKDQYFVLTSAPKEVEDYYLEITSSIKIASSLN